jgi:hypothetical protein
MKMFPTDISVAKAILFNKGIADPTNAQIATECMRTNRNLMLKSSDWMAVADRTMTQAQIDYRQALRDLPATADPQLDENGNLH